MSEHIAGLQAYAARFAVRKLQNKLSKAAAWYRICRVWLAFLNGHSFSIGCDVDYVEWLGRILHPEISNVRIFEDEQHALAFGQFLAKHEAS